jgi:hypothetical protein
MPAPRIRRSGLDFNQEALFTVQVNKSKRRNCNSGVLVDP